MTLEEEKEKSTHSHRLEIRRIWLDRFLLAILIGLAGLIGNFIFEGYKSDLAKTQFLLESRLEALKDIRVSFSKLIPHAYAELTRRGSAQSRANDQAYRQDVNEFMHTINRWGFLFTDAFTHELTHHAWLHQAIAGPDIELAIEHWGFLMDTVQAFDASTRRALNVEVLGTPPETKVDRFRLRLWRSEDVLVKGAAEVFRDNFSKWQQERKTK